MRDETGLYYLHADRLGSTMAVTNESGKTVDDHGYYAYGRDRRGSELRTAYRFTGQQGDASGLIYMNARYYDRSAELTSKPQIGQFLSPDTVVPDATHVFDYNRYMYARGNPMKYTDPSGYDPLDSAWETAFRGEHGRDPTDADRQARLYSLLYTGPVTGKQAWTSDDWHYFTENRASLFKDSSPARASLNDFAASIQTLGGFYSAGEEEQFVWAIALLYAGVPYGTQLRGVLSQGFGGARITVPGCNELLCLWLSHGMNGFSSKVTTNEENTHHYAGHLLAGFYLWNWVGNLSTRVREYAQGGVHFNGWRPAFAPDQVDIAMGDIAQEHGRNLATGYLTIWDLPNAIRKALAP